MDPIDCQTLISTAYSYDDTWQLTGETVTASLAWSTLTPDQWGTLTEAQWATLPLDPVYSSATTYDNCGNPMVEVTTSGTVTCTFDDAHRMLTRVTAAGTTTFTYDGAGNRLTRQEPGGAGTTTFTWDGDGRLSKVQTPAGGTFTLTYHADGMLTSRQSAGGTTKFVWNGNVLQAKTDGSGTVTTAFNQGQGEYGNLVNTRDVAGSADNFILPDAQGTAAGQTDDSGAVTGTTILDAFGNVVDTTGTPDETLAYIAKQGYLFDPDLGLYYVRDRWYDPETKRWISADPLAYAIESYNHYSYVNNSPLRFGDPSGLLLCAFDGTGNTPADSTNVYNFSNVYVGKVFYMAGVGTHKEKLAGLEFGKGTNERIQLMKTLVEGWTRNHPDDRELDIIGFSRGAAAARAFANEIQPLVSGPLKVNIRFIGVWDTVPSMGPEHGKGGLNLDLPPSFRGKAFHAISIDEDRSKFAVEIYEGAKNVWFPGVHSDVGGGYTKRSFSNNALRWMLFHALQTGVPVKYQKWDFPSPFGDYVRGNYSGRAIANFIQGTQSAFPMEGHDEMTNNLIMWLVNWRLNRTIPAGSEIHSSAFWFLPLVGFPTNRKVITTLFPKAFPGYILNDDDDWISDRTGESGKPWDPSEFYRFAYGDYPDPPNARPGYMQRDYTKKGTPHSIFDSGKLLDSP